jgi:hypothetical protein
MLGPNNRAQMKRKKKATPSAMIMTTSICGFKMTAVRNRIASNAAITFTIGCPI